MPSSRSRTAVCHRGEEPRDVREKPVLSFMWLTLHGAWAGDGEGLALLQRPPCQVWSLCSSCPTRVSLLESDRFLRHHVPTAKVVNSHDVVSRATETEARLDKDLYLSLCQLPPECLEVGRLGSGCCKGLIHMSTSTSMREPHSQHDADC